MASDRKDLQRAALTIAAALKPQHGDDNPIVPEGVSYTVILADYGEANTGNMAYASTANREDVVRMLREMADILETDTDGQHRRKD